MMYHMMASWVSVECMEIIKLWALQLKLQVLAFRLDSSCETYGSFGYQIAVLVLSSLDLGKALASKVLYRDFDRQGLGVVPLCLRILSNLGQTNNSCLE